jgi:hypothetical protein
VTTGRNGEGGRSQFLPKYQGGCVATVAAPGHRRLACCNALERIRCKVPIRVGCDDHMNEQRVEMWKSWVRVLREHKEFLKRLDWLGFYFGIPIGGYIGVWFWKGSIMWALPVLFIAWFWTLCGLSGAYEIGPKSKVAWAVLLSLIPVAVFYLVSHRHPEIAKASETTNSIQKAPPGRSQTGMKSGVILACTTPLLADNTLRARVAVPA